MITQRDDLRTISGRPARPLTCVE